MYFPHRLFADITPTITKHTRITSTSATLVDQIYTNNITTARKLGINITYLADNFGTFHISQSQKTFTKLVEDNENVFGRQQF